MFSRDNYPSESDKERKMKKWRIIFEKKNKDKKTSFPINKFYGLTRSNIHMSGNTNKN